MKTLIIFLTVLVFYVYPQEGKTMVNSNNSIVGTSTIQTKISELFLTVEGSNNKEVILLLHGGPGVPDYLDEVASMLSNNFRTVRFDQRGVGKSRALNNQYAVSDYISDIDAIREYLKVEKVHIFGHSWGGLLAQLYASEYPDRVISIYLCSPSSGTGDVWKQMEREVMKYNKTQASGLEWMSMGWYSLWGAMGFDFGYKKIFANVWRYYFREPKSVSNPDSEWLDGIRARAVNETRKSMVQLDNDEFTAKFYKVNVPVLLTYGKYDIYGPSRTSKIEKLTNAKYVEFENAGHLPWIQDKETFKKMILEFYSISNN